MIKWWSMKFMKYSHRCYKQYKVNIEHIVSLSDVFGF